ncbi:hypothetical protein PILCRDRAFT_483184 [Piloderma croceum F 1598]|uniref:Uncharacterized protein n=1 Tax=Piloderma croceum (strain F 1598) TaxID=765440 RepID=A0A0C3FS80_PILCF|nr:hypothetical protein PILCRDRAFT_483184 [Piloderma croceum F 1598]
MSSSIRCFDRRNTNNESSRLALEVSKGFPGKLFRRFIGSPEYRVAFDPMSCQLSKNPGAGEDSRMWNLQGCSTIDQRSISGECG